MARTLLTPEKRDEDAMEASLRPQSLDDFVGQEQARANLRVFIQAAKTRKDALDHVLFAGPPASAKPRSPRSWRRNWASVSAPPPARSSRRPATSPPSSPTSRTATSCSSTRSTASTPAVEEVLYPAMEDFQLDLIIGEGPAARSVRIDLARFTLVGATTRAGLLTTPLRDRFGIPVRLDFYTIPELEFIVKRGRARVRHQDRRRRRP